MVHRNAFIAPREHGCARDGVFLPSKHRLHDIAWLVVRIFRFKNFTNGAPRHNLPCGKHGDIRVALHPRPIARHQRKIMMPDKDFVVLQGSNLRGPKLEMLRANLSTGRWTYHHCRLYRLWASPPEACDWSGRDKALNTWFITYTPRAAQDFFRMRHSLVRKRSSSGIREFPPARPVRNPRCGDELQAVCPRARLYAPTAYLISISDDKACGAFTRREAA